MLTVRSDGCLTFARELYIKKFSQSQEVRVTVQHDSKKRGYLNRVE